jgi:hypothetical protein
MKLRTALAAALMLGSLPSLAEAASVTLTWTAPTTRTDGSPITGALSTQVWDAAGGGPAAQIGTASTSPFTTPQLAPGSHSFYVVVCEAGGQCSAPSNVVPETIVIAAPAAVIDLSGAIGP